MRDIDRIERIEFGCFSCGKMISCDRDTLDCPSGAVVFDGGDNFGSSVYDALMDGIMVRILICDECLENKKDRLRKKDVGKEAIFNKYWGPR